MKSFNSYSKENYLTEEAMLFEKLAHGMNQYKKMLKVQFKLKEADLKEVSANRLAVLTDKNRQKMLEDLANALAPLGWRYNRSTKISSIGHLEQKDNKDHIIFVKPKSRQGVHSAGIDNEFALVGGINESIKENGGPLDVVFVSGGKKVEYKDIAKALEVGTDTANRKKADIKLVTSKGREIPISIKKDGAEIWESADKYWGEMAGKFITQLLTDNKIKMDLQNAGHYKLSPNFAVKANPKELKDVVFGSDILKGKGAVVERTFKSKDFLHDGAKNRLLVNVSNLILTPSDVKGRDTPWFLVRNDSTRNDKQIGFAGIRVLSVFESRINKNVLRVKRNIVK